MLKHVDMCSVRSRWAALLLVVGALAFASGCTKEIESRWRDGEVAIDGKNTEWEGALASFDDGEILVGAMNDDEFLYLSLFLADREKQRQVLAQGCTVWFDGEGGKEKLFGIRFPLGGRVRPGAPRGEAGEGPSSPDTTVVPEMAEEVSSDLEVLGAGGTSLRRQVSGEGGIDVAIQVYEGSLVYEAKVPLSAAGAHPFGIGAVPGRTIGIGLETPEIEKRSRDGGPEGRGAMGGRGGGGPPGGGGGGPGGGGRPGGARGGMGGGPPGGGPGGGAQDQPEPLKLRVKVKLTSLPDA